MPPRVLIASICKHVKTAAVVIDQPSHQPRLAERAHLSGCRIQCDVRESGGAIAPDTLASQSFQRYLEALARKRHQRSETNTIAFGCVCAAAGGCGCGDSIAEPAAQGFDFEVPPARFIRNFGHEIRGEGR